MSAPAHEGAVRPGRLLRGPAWTVAISLASVVLIAAAPLDRGLAAFRKGDYQAADRILSAAAKGATDPVLSYDAGVAAMKLGRLDDAVKRFERASVNGQGKVKAAALIDLGICHVHTGDAAAAAAKKSATKTSKKPAKKTGKKPAEPMPISERIQRLQAAAGEYRSALAAFREVDPEDADSKEGAKAAKVRLLSTLDRVQKLQKEQQKKQQEERLSHPSQLLFQMLTEERDRRRTAFSLEGVAKRHRLLPALRLRKREYRARELLSRLETVLADAAKPENGAKAGGPVPTATVPSAAAKKAAPAVKRAISSMEDVEGRLDALDAKEAVSDQTQALSALIDASKALPPSLPDLTRKLLDDQSSLLDITQSAGEDPIPAEEDEIGSWLTSLSEVQAPAKAKRGTSISAAAMAKIQKLAAEADAAAEKALGLLEGKSPDSSVPDQKTVIEKLKEIGRLLPRSPETPQQRLQDLLDAEKKAQKSVGDLVGAAPQARAKQEPPLAESQTEHGREASSIAKALSHTRSKNAETALQKTKDAAEEIDASSEALRRDRVSPAKGDVGRAVKSIEDALAALSGRSPQGRKKQGGPKRQQPKSKGGAGRKKQKKEYVPLHLTPDQAKRLMAEQDRRRLDAQKTLRAGGGGPKVDKDW